LNRTSIVAIAVAYPIVEPREVVAHLLERARWSASRSSGPGGQRRDKVETRAELTLDMDALEGLDPALASRLSARLGLSERPLRITAQESRSLAENREHAADRLANLVAEALAPPPPPRRPTRPTRAARQERLAAKSVRSTVKRLRQRPVDSD
jgi:ribosome-associated protein